MKKYITALRKEHPKATEILQNEHGDYDVHYRDEFQEEVHTYSPYKGKLLYVGVLSWEV